MGINSKNIDFISQSECMEKYNAEEEGKQTWAQNNSPNFQNISSIIDMTAGLSSSSEEPYIMKFSEFQINQLISELWIQANLSDNLPSNIEAIAHSFCLTLISLRLENPEDSLVLSFFQLPLSLWKKSLDNNNGTLSPANQRSLLILSAAMLMFAAKIYQIPDMDRPLKSLLESDVDPYLGISGEYQVYVKPQAEVKQYCSIKDNQVAASQLIKLQSEIGESGKTVVEMFVQSLSDITAMTVDDTSMQLSELFMPDDAYLFRPQTFDMDPTLIIPHSKEQTFYEDDDDVVESPVPGIEHIMKRERSSKARMDIFNSALYLENCHIIRENERLRKKAEELNKKNQALLSELNLKRSEVDSNPQLGSGPTAPMNSTKREAHNHN